MSVPESFTPYITAVAAYDRLVAVDLEVEKDDARDYPEAQLAFAGICAVVAASPELVATYQNLIDQTEREIPDQPARVQAIQKVRALEAALIQKRRDVGAIGGQTYLQEQNQIGDAAWLTRQARAFTELFATVIDGTWNKSPKPKPKKIATPAKPSRLTPGEPLVEDTFGVIIDPDNNISIEGHVFSLALSHAVVMRMLIDTYRAAPGYFISVAALKALPVWQNYRENIDGDSNVALRNAIFKLSRRLGAGGFGDLIETRRSSGQGEYRLRIGSLVETDSILNNPDRAKLKPRQKARPKPAKPPRPEPLLKPPEPTPVAEPEPVQPEPTANPDEAVPQLIPPPSDMPRRPTLPTLIGTPEPDPIERTVLGIFEEVTLAELAAHFNSSGRATSFVIKGMRSGTLSSREVDGKTYYYPTGKTTKP